MRVEDQMMRRIQSDCPLCSPSEANSSPWARSGKTAAYGAQTGSRSCR